MKFLLVALNAKYIHSNPALYSLRAYAGEQLQEHVEIAEYTINQSLTDILADIYRRKPEVIGLSCYIWNIEMMLDLVKELSKLLPDVPIWLGGPEVTYDAPKLLAKYSQITGVMIGEGEETFRELMDYYHSGKLEMADIAGIVYRNQEGVVRILCKSTSSCQMCWRGNSIFYVGRGGRGLATHTGALPDRWVYHSQRTYEY